jgi:FkbM family methyltransferase
MNSIELKASLRQQIEKSRRHVRLSDRLNDLRTGPIVIYGAGYVGKYACDILKNNGITPHFFLDEKAETAVSYAGVPIKTVAQDDLDSPLRAKATVILCVLSKWETEEGIIETLCQMGYRTIIPFKQKAFSTDFITARGVASFEPSLADYADELLAAADLFTDEASVATYHANIGAFCERRFDNVPFLPVARQYVPDDIEFTKGYSRFVDCGAFWGDTIEKLVQSGRTPETFFAFEPDQRNFRALSAKVDELSLRNGYLFPCGVSSKTATLRFKNDATYAGAASALDPAGDTVIQCVALDDALKNVRPTFIKMDIEGAEIDALHGARAMIERDRPDLAICVYHYVNHYFEIPLLLKSWNPDYRFSMRTYDTCGNETVVYASSSL